MFKMAIYLKINFISYFMFFFLSSIDVLSYTLMLPVSQPQTQQLMTSQIRSLQISARAKHSIQTF